MSNSTIVEPNTELIRSTFFYITIPFTIPPILLPMMLYLRRNYLPLKVHGVIPLTLKCIAAFLYYVVILLNNLLHENETINGPKRDAREIFFSFGCVFLPSLYLYPFFVNCYSVNITFLLNYWKAKLLVTEDSNLKTKIHQRIRFYSLALNDKFYILSAVLLSLFLGNIFFINMIVIFTTEESQVTFLGVGCVALIGFFFTFIICTLLIIIGVNKVKERFYLRVTLLANLIDLVLVVLLVCVDGLVILAVPRDVWRVLFIRGGFVFLNLILTLDILVTVALPLLLTFSWKKKDVTQSDLANLMWILDDSYSFSLFREYCVTEWASEYADFYKVVGEWDKLIEKGATIQTKSIVNLANTIFNTFIDQNGPLALNLSGAKVKQAEEALEQQHLHTFKQHVDTIMKDIVIPQLEDIFSRFKATSKYAEHKVKELVLSDSTVT